MFCWEHFSTSIIFSLTAFIFRTMHPGCFSWGSLGVNTWDNTENGDWAFQVALMFQRTLQLAEITAVESWILSMQGGFTPAHLQVMSAR